MIDAEQYFNIYEYHNISSDNILYCRILKYIYFFVIYDIHEA